MIHLDDILPTDGEPIPRSERSGHALAVVHVQEASRWFRARFELRTRARTEAFLAHAGLTPASCPRMRELATLDALERHHAATREARLKGARGFTRPPEDR